MRQLIPKDDGDGDEIVGCLAQEGRRGSRVAL